MMLLRLILKNKEKYLLCPDGSMVKADSAVLEMLFLNFQHPEQFGGYPDRWDYAIKNMENYFAKTLAYVNNHKELVVVDNTAFSKIVPTFNPDRYITLEEYSDLVGKSVSRIKTLCQQGRMAGAKRKGGVWFVPKSTTYPIKKK